MGNCFKDAPLPVEFEVKQPPRTSLKGSEQSRNSSLPPWEGRAAGSPGPSLEISKSIETLAKQLDQSRSWQEGMSQIAKFTHVVAETRLLEAKLESLKRKSMAPGLTEEQSSEVTSEYLALERELEQHMNSIHGSMGAIKQEVADLNKQVWERAEVERCA